MRHVIICSALVAAASGCAGSYRPPATAPAIVPGEIEHTLLLIGDAGAPRLPDEPVYIALRAAASEAPTRTTIVFMGDNIYPHGLPAVGQPDRAVAEERLAAQVAAVPDGATGYFVMGNHDWERGGKGGWDAVRRQGDFIERIGGADVSDLPPAGCPGPAVRDRSRRLRLILLDTQWWLHGGPKPLGPPDGCRYGSTGEITAALREAVEVDSGRIVVVAAHHPLVTGGVHGGKFDWKDHIFPLRAISGWLWVPLPIIGSLYPLVRGSGISAQDTPSGENTAMRDSLISAFQSRPPLAYASGHEHNLQILAGDVPPYRLVSGSGTYGHTTKVFRISQTLYAYAVGGFMRLDVLRDGRVRLGVIVPDSDGRIQEDYAMWLAP